MESLDPVFDELPLPPGGSTLAWPPFLAFVLYDGLSLAFRDFMSHGLNDFGAAWGHAVFGCKIGPPNESDDVYRSACSTARAAVDIENTAAWPEHVQDRGTPDNLKIYQTGQLAQRLGVSRDAFPCLALQANYPSGSVALFRVRSEWLESDRSRRLLSDGLRQGLSEPTVRNFIGDELRPADERLDLMREHLDFLHDEIARNMRRSHGAPIRLLSKPGIKREAAKRALVIVEASHQVFIHGRDVKVEPMPFRLLLFLAEGIRNGGGVVPREATIDFLWRGECVQDNALDAVIKRMRETLSFANKSGKSRAPVEIETVRNVGHHLNLSSDEIQIF